MITCDCGRSRKGERHGGGWKHHLGRTWCPDCWHRAYKLRAIAFPVAGPVDRTWPELRAALKECWGWSTTLANWTVSKLAQSDVVRTPELGKLPAMQPLYLYPLAREILPDMDTGSVVSVLQSTEQKYRKRRYAALWTRSESLPSFRYPVPYPVHNQRWSVGYGKGSEPLVTLPLAGERWTLRLRGGHEFRRQLAAFRLLAEGEAVKGELSLYRVSGSNGDHRPHMHDRAESSQARSYSRLMCKLVMWLPVKERPGLSGTLHVRTADDAFWVWHLGPESDRIQRYHADHVRRWQREYERRTEALADDTKLEKRRPRRAKRGLAQRRGAWVQKQRHRMDSWTHEATAMLAGVAERAAVATVEYDDTRRTYLPDGPYAQLRERLACKLGERGITLELASGAVVQEPAEPLELEES